MNKRIIIITGTRKGIGRYLVEYYANACGRYRVYGCSRKESDFKHSNYYHFCLDVTDEKAVKDMFLYIKKVGQPDILINNAGIASMNHSLLTSVNTVEKIMKTNFMGTFLLCREAAKVMNPKKGGRIVNFTTVAVPHKLEGEAVYASSKAAVATLTQILAKELAIRNITVNAIGPTPIETDLIRNVSKQKIDALLKKQAIQRLGKFQDVSNVIDFFISEDSNFVTGQIIYLGGV